MSSIADSETRIAEEAGRLLVEAHETWLFPKFDALKDKISLDLIRTIDPEGKNIFHMSLFFAQRDFDQLIPFRFVHKKREVTLNKAIMETIVSAQSKIPEAAMASGYLLPENAHGVTFDLALLLRLGGWERNQPYHGLLCLCWPKRSKNIPLFDLPIQHYLLPGYGGLKFCPLPHEFERTKKKDAGWISFPANIKRSLQWKDFESAVAVVSTAGEKILNRLVPILNDAAWKAMARRVMHELSRTVAMPQPILEESRKALNSALGTVRRSDLPSQCNLKKKLIGFLKTIDGNLGELQNDQTYVLSKVRWFFYLVAEELRAEAPERNNLLNIIRQSIDSLGFNPDEDCRFDQENTNSWLTCLQLPHLFPQHCFESFLSNAFLHRIPNTPVIFNITKGKNNDLNFSWTNQTESHSANRLSEELAKPANLRTFGLRMAESISNTFFMTSLDIQVHRYDGRCLIDHQISIPEDLLLFPGHK
ncbi:MAG: hypothetical protein ACFE0O_04435 [Opitutales bacterium]